MAITTTQKLVSSLKKSLPFPDAFVINDGDLQHSLWQYAGVLVAPPIPIAPLIIGLSAGLTIGHGIESLLLVGSGSGGAIRRSRGGSQGLSRGQGMQGGLVRGHGEQG